MITCEFPKTLKVTNNCTCALDWTTPASIGTCRLRIQGYFDGMIANCPGAAPSVDPAWDGTFPNILIVGGELYKSNDPVSIQGKGISGNGINLGFSGGIWSLFITDNTFSPVYIARLTATCPIGTFIHAADPQCDAGPATVTLEGYTP